MNGKIEIEFMDGEKRVILGANAAYVENGALHVENTQKDNGIIYAEVKDLGSFPLVNIRSYHWME